MISNSKAMRFGPEYNENTPEGPKGNCLHCGGQCEPECGKHPLGCFYGGFSKGYWMIADNCQLYHGEE